MTYNSLNGQIKHHRFNNITKSSNKQNISQLLFTAKDSFDKTQYTCHNEWIQTRLTCVVDLLQFLPHEIRQLIFQRLAFQALLTPENLAVLIATTTQMHMT